MQTSPITGHLVDNCLFRRSTVDNVDHANGDQHHDSWEDVRQLNERREIPCVTPKVMKW